MFDPYLDNPDPLMTMTERQRHDFSFDINNHLDKLKGCVFVTYEQLIEAVKGNEEFEDLLFNDECHCQDDGPFNPADELRDLALAHASTGLYGYYLLCAAQFHATEEGIWFHWSSLHVVNAVVDLVDAEYANPTMADDCPQVIWYLVNGGDDSSDYCGSHLSIALSVIEEWARVNRVHIWRINEVRENPMDTTHLIKYPQGY